MKRSARGSANRQSVVGGTVMTLRSIAGWVQRELLQHPIILTARKPMLNCSGGNGFEPGLPGRIFVGWQVAYGRPNILAVPTAGCLSPRQGSSIQTSTLAVSAVRFAGARSTRGLAIMIFSTGKSIRRGRPCLGKGGVDQRASQRQRAGQRRRRQAATDCGMN